LKFKHIVVYTLKEFNKNKEKDGYLPQDGSVINVFLSGSTLANSVAVGFDN